MAATGYPWRFLVTDRQSATIALLDRLARNREVNAGLNVPWSIGGECPSDSLEINQLGDDDDPFLAFNSRFVFGLRQEVPGSWDVRASGIIMQVEDVAGSNTPRSTFTAYDPWKYLYNRPITLADGRLPTNEMRFDGVPGNEIALQLLQNTDVWHGSCYIDFASGTFETTDPLHIGFTQGTTVGDAWDQLVATGSMDIVLNPVYDPATRPGIISELSIYSFAGVDRNDAIFAWDQPSRSLVGISHLLDGTGMANKIRGFTSDGQPSGAVQTDAPSVAKYGQFWLEQFVSGQPVPAAVELLMLAQLQLRRRGKESLTVTPAPERSPVPLLDYFPGDSVPIHASNRLRQRIDGLKRVYAIPIKLRDNSTETVEGLLMTEPDA